MPLEKDPFAKRRTRKYNLTIFQETYDIMERAHEKHPTLSVEELIYRVFCTFLGEGYEPPVIRRLQREMEYWASITPKPRPEEQRWIDSLTKDRVDRILSKDKTPEDTGEEQCPESNSSDHQEQGKPHTS